MLNVRTVYLESHIATSAQIAEKFLNEGNYAIEEIPLNPPFAKGENPPLADRGIWLRSEMRLGRAAGRLRRKGKIE